MPPLKYHAGQTAIQAEAKTTHVAERLAYWVGPFAEFAQGADLFILTTANPDGTLGFTVLSGAPPLVQFGDDANAPVRYKPGESASPEVSEVRIRFRPGLGPAASTLTTPTPCGGLAINFAQARRVRLNGLLTSGAKASELLAAETFTLCRKYIAPSRPLEDAPHVGPVTREPLPLDDPWLARLVALSETAFLASINPDGRPDVSHRGGSAGFLKLDAAARRLTWNEYVGDGVFKSAGNIRANGIVTLLVPDLASGDGVELIGRAEYANQRTQRGQRLDALEQHGEHFPLQGVMTCHISRAMRVQGLMRPRERFENIAVTSRSTVDEQAPQ